MTQFITGPEERFGNSRIVNLKSVTNIAFEEFVNRHNQMTYKIILNFSYGISLKKNTKKRVPDYCYFIYDEKDAYDVMVDTLTDLIHEKEWIAPRIGGVINRIINPDKISFISKDPGHNRIIINIAASVSFYNDFERITSDFIFLDFSDEQEYEENLEYLKASLDEKSL